MVLYVYYSMVRVSMTTAAIDVTVVLGADLGLPEEGFFFTSFSNLNMCEC
jgi:hypothetical protein